MSQNSILVRNIIHLTDARYYAAMGVDWMSMELNEDQISFSRWHALKDWVEGVMLAAEITTEDEVVIARAIIDAKPDGIVTDNLDLIHLTGGMQLFYVTDHFSKSDTQLAAQILFYSPHDFQLETVLHFPPEHIYLEANWTETSLNLLLDKGYNGGFCFRGSSEEQLGMKDYSQMDRMIESIKNA